jgi:hypothetical protein
MASTKSGPNDGLVRVPGGASGGDNEVTRVQLLDVLTALLPDLAQLYIEAITLDRALLDGSPVVAGSLWNRLVAVADGCDAAREALAPFTLQLESVEPGESVGSV